MASSSIDGHSDSQQAAARRARKRSRYTPHACQRCQKAKVRCDGRLPCAYCAAREGECQYSVQAPPNFQVHVTQAEDDHQSLQALSVLLREQNEKLDLLLKKTAIIEAPHQASTKSETGPSNTSTVAVLPQRKQPLPLFQTSTSAFFCVNVVDAGARKLRLDLPDTHPPPARAALSIIHGEVVHGESSDISRTELDDDNANTALDGSFRHQYGPARPAGSDPLDEMDHGNLLQALQTFADFESPMYPILDMPSILQKARSFSPMPPGALPGPERKLSMAQNVNKDDLAILKMAVAIGLLAEGDASQHLASRLFESVRPDVEAMIWSAAVDLKDLVLMALVTLFYFHCGRWRLAWRFQGNVSRIILELGLNRRVVLDRCFPDIKSRIQAINTIWTIFVLEQHLSYALGFSNAMPNLRLDSNFPQPVDAAFLGLMIDYATIGRQSCDALLSDKILSPEQQITWQDDYAYFQYRVSLWAMRASETFPDDTLHPGFEMIRKTLDFRANHLRTLIARAFLCSGLRNAAPLNIWSIVDIAADTIEKLTRLDASRKEYKFHQAQFNHFLASALDVLLFATTHKASGIESPSANGEELSIPDETAQKAQRMAMVALNRLRILASLSNQSKYLWDRVRLMALRLNLSDRLLPETPGEAVATHAQCATSTADLAEGTLQTDLVATHPLPLFDTESNPFENNFGAFPASDAAGWGFHMPAPSPFEFDLTQDMSALLNPNWIP